MADPTGNGVLAEAAARAADAYSACGYQISPGQLDDELAEIADRAQQEWRRFYDARRAGRELDYPVTAVVDLLSVVSALRAALQYTPTPTAAEITDEVRDGDVVTAAGDDVRLHMASAHRNLPCLGMSDREALQEHERLHAGGDFYGPVYQHDPDDLAWSLARVHQNIIDMSGTWDPRQFDTALHEHMERVTNPAGSSPAFDQLRLHLLARHGVLTALGMTGTGATERHDQEHDIPGADHTPDSREWSNVDQVVQDAIRSPGLMTGQAKERLILLLRVHRGRMQGRAEL